MLKNFTISRLFRPFLLILILGLFLAVPFKTIAADSIAKSSSVVLDGLVLEHITYIQIGDQIEVSTNVKNGAVILSNQNPIYVDNRSEKSLTASNFILAPSI